MAGYNAWLSSPKAGETAVLKKLTWLSGRDIPQAGRAIEELELAFGKADLDAGRWELTLEVIEDLGPEDYEIRCENNRCAIRGGESGILYGSFAFIKGEKLEKLRDGWQVHESPRTPLRLINHWDNMDGSIERGYAGNSFFFENQEILINERTRDYCRLAASAGINAVAINNVNVKDRASLLISPLYYGQLRELGELFQSYGIRLYLSLNYALPVETGELDTADPLDPAVIAWWDRKMAEVFSSLPMLGGFVVKADSEGRPGPFTYGRDQSEGANLLAKALEPYGASLIWRAFVYNAQQDWRDYRTDRARAAYDYFAPLDGKFRPNVYLQIKNGPMDFQVREPVSPLFCKLQKTNLILELQITQEYTGHQIDLCYLAPQWREILDFRTENPGSRTTGGALKDLMAGRALPGIRTGMAAVSNTGNDENWFGHDLAGLNYYAYGCLAWDPAKDSGEIAREWIALTFDLPAQPAEKLLKMLLASWSVYELYTAPLGIGWMVTPHTHYGPSVDGYEYDRWGTYHRADHLGIGVDRSHRGTGTAGLYPGINGELYEDPERCPDELVLFFHHLPYTHKLHSGKTVIQHIYDSRFEGAARAEDFLRQWEELEDFLEPEIYRRVRQRFLLQVRNAREWRDQVNSYFYRKSFIPDEENRHIYG